MPKQSLLRWIKRCRLYERRGDFGRIPLVTRGLYVLYRERPRTRTGEKVFEVAYFGVAGVAKNATRGIGTRLREHDKSKKKWTHYSFFEVHDNLSNDEIHELEGLLLRIFIHDPRLELENSQFGFGKLKRLAHKSMWKE